MQVENYSTEDYKYKWRNYYCFDNIALLYIVDFPNIFEKHFWSTDEHLLVNLNSYVDSVLFNVNKVWNTLGFY